MNLARYFRALLPLLLLLPGLAGCQAVTGELGEGESERQILVVIPQPAAIRVASGFRRYSHGQRYGAIPIHIRAKIDRLRRAHHLVETDGWSIRSINAYCAVFALQKSHNLEQLLADIGADPEVSFAQPMNHFKTLVSSTGRDMEDPYAGIQYGEDVRHLHRLHAFTRGENVKIAVVDSPVDGRHPDLAGQVKATVSFVDTHDIPDQLHGTAVAGIISARDNNGEGGLGFAPAAELHAYSACSHDGVSGALCNSFNLARALAAVIDDGIDIINLSLAGPEDPLLALLLTEALQRKIIVIASEHRGHPGDNFPASMPGVIAVGKMAAANRAAPAPGNRHGFWYQQDERLSTRAGGGYQFFYGSSIASAGVTGLAVLIRSHYSSMTTRQWLEAATSGDCERLPAADEQSGLFGALEAAIGCNSRFRINHQLLSRTSRSAGAGSISVE